MTNIVIANQWRKHVHIWTQCIFIFHFFALFLDFAKWRAFNLGRKLAAVLLKTESVPPSLPPPTPWWARKQSNVWNFNVIYFLLAPFLWNCITKQYKSVEKSALFLFIIISVLIKQNNAKRQPKATNCLGLTLPPRGILHTSSDGDWQKEFFGGGGGGVKYSIPGCCLGREVCQVFFLVAWFKKGFWGILLALAA